VPFYENGHATDDATATGQNGCLGKRYERQPGKAEADRKADREALNEMNANMKTNQKMMKSNQTKATKQEEILAQISVRNAINLKEMEADRDREDLQGMMDEMNAKMDDNQAEMRSTICAFRSHLNETTQHEMKAVMQPIRAELDETTACNGATETEPDPGMMQSIEEHQEIPKGEAAVMPVRGSRKRRRVRNLAAERRQKLKERTRGKSGSRGKSTAACRKVSDRAKVAW
jgi:hypothetical protein